MSLFLNFYNLYNSFGSGNIIDHEIASIGLSKPDIFIGKNFFSIYTFFCALKVFAKINLLKKLIFSVFIDHLLPPREKSQKKETGKMEDLISKSTKNVLKNSF